jgi:tellurite resistance protein
LKDKLKNVVSTFIQQGTDIMTEWAGKNIHLLHKERCHSILKKSLQILECIVSYHSEVIIQPNWPSANTNHLTLFLFKIYFSGVYFNHQDLQEFFELPTDVITLTGIKILTKQPNDEDALRIYNNLNLADINNSTDKEYEFIAETLNLFDQIIKTTTLSLWSFNQQSMKQATAVNNLKAKLTALQTLNATHATAMAIAKATESLNEKTSQDEYKELRISNLDKNLKKYEQKTNEIIKKIKNNINQNKKQKSFNGAQFTESLDNSPTKTLHYHKEWQMVDLTNNNEEETQKPPPPNQKKRNLQTRQRTHQSPPMKKPAIQWKASEIKQYNPAFSAATPSHSTLTHPYTPIYTSTNGPPLFFQQAPPPTPIPAPSPNPFTIFKQGSNNPTHRSQFQQPLTPFHNPGFSTTPNPFALTNPFQKTGMEQQISKPTRSHNKRLNNQKPTANRSKRFREE